MVPPEADGPLRSFHPRTIQRGEDYYRDGRVTSIRFEDGQFVASVQGSRSRPYTVWMAPGDPKEAECTCPVGYRCRHIVATLIALRRQAEGETPQTWKRQSRPRSPRWVGHESGARYRLVFLVDPHAGSDGPTVHPARQYRRNDGEWGKIDRVRLQEPLLAASPEDRRLAEKLLLQSSSAPVLIYLDELRRASAPVYAGSLRHAAGAQSRRVTVIEPLRFRVEATPRLEDPHTGYAGIFARRYYPRTSMTRPLGAGEAPSIVLDLELCMEGAGGKAKVIAGASLAAAKGLGKTVALFSNGVLAVSGEGGALDAVAGLWGYDGEVPPDWAELHLAGCEKWPGEVEVRIPRSVRLEPKELEPAAVFTPSVEARFNELTLETVPTELEEDGYRGDEYVMYHHVQPDTKEFTDRVAAIVGRSPESGAGAESARWSLPGLSLLEFAGTHGRALAEAGFTVMVRDADGLLRRLKRSAEPKIIVSSGVDWFELRVENRDDGPLDWRRLRELLERGVCVSGESVLVLDDEHRAKIAELAQLLDDPEGGRIRKGNIGAAARAAELADEAPADLESIRRLVHMLLDPAARPPIDLPVDLRADLRPYQAEGFRWLAMMASHGLSGCLADDMGLGKTVQALALMLHLAEGATVQVNPPPRRFLVIAPVSTLENWRREANRFAPGLSVYVHHGASRATNPARAGARDLVVTSYATAIHDHELLAQIKWALVCLDEAQFIKNPRTKTARLVKSLPSEIRLCLTGTPVENATTDLWSIIDFLSPGLLGPLGEFTRRFGKGRGKSRERMEKLQRITRPFILRRTKAAVAPDLPPRIDSHLHCEMSTRQARFYHTLKVAHRTKVMEAIRSRDLGRIGTAMFTGILRLRQAALYPADADPTGAGVPSAKEEELLLSLGELVAEGHKALVFSQFVSALRRLERKASAAGIRTCYLDGGTTKRQPLIDRFQTSADPAVFFISLKAGGTGINLTAADYVFLCDPWWNPAVEQQAIDRTHRIGQENPVMVYRMITTGTIEEKVMELQEQKRDLADRLIAADMDTLSAAVAGASAEEILRLFE